MIPIGTRPTTGVAGRGVAREFAASFDMVGEASLLIDPQGEAAC